MPRRLAATGLIRHFKPMHDPRRFRLPKHAPPAKAKLLFVVGADRPDRVKRLNGKVIIRGSSDFQRLLERREPYHRLHLTPNYLQENQPPDLSGYDCLLNLITEAEGNDRVLDNLSRLIRGFAGKVINRPEAVLETTRDAVARRLSGIAGLIVPKVLRTRHSRPEAVIDAIAAAGLRFPIIVRKTGTHGGNVLGCFDSIDSLRRELSEGGEYFAIEFVDCRMPDGLFRKYRVFFIGGRRIFRSVIASDQWNIHAKDGRRFMLERPALIDAEKAMFATPEGSFPEAVHKTLEAIGGRMPLDYFGVDFALTNDDELVLFEANATMNFYTWYDDPRFSYLDRAIPPAQAAFRDLLGLNPLPAIVVPRPGMARRKLPASGR